MKRSQAIRGAQHQPQKPPLAFPLRGWVQASTDALNLMRWQLQLLVQKRKKINKLQFVFYCLIALFGQSTCSDFCPDWFAVCGLVKKWSRFETALPGPRWSSEQEKLVAQQKLGPHAAEVEKYVTFFKSRRTVASTFTLPLLDICGFVVIYLFIYFCLSGVFFQLCPVGPFSTCFGI